VSVNDPSKCVLEGRGLRVLRGSKLVLRDVDVALHAGEVLGVLGPSGAGKSTLFRALVGEIPLAGGTVRYLGEDITSAPLWVRARAGIGYVPQTPSVLLDLTVQQNLATYQRIALGAVDDVGAAALRVGLEDKLLVRAGDLSAGERRRLEVARAITPMRPKRTAEAVDPKVLVCDEPFAGVDPAGAARLGELLQKLAKERGVAVVLADHHVPEALRVCDVASLLLDGAIALTADPATFETDALVRTRYLGRVS
jgi:lipopolysaccharide export system ATP-binding protein